MDPARSYHPRGAGFLPAGIVCEWRGGQLALILDQLARRVLWWQGRRRRFLRLRLKLIAEFVDKTLRRPRTGFTESADRSARDVVCDVDQGFRILDHAAAKEHAV